MSIRSAVEAGAELLDEHAPGWHNRVDLDTLETRMPSACVLAQSLGNGSYTNGKTELENRSGMYINPLHFGFDSDSSDYRTADAEWKRAIEARRATDASGVDGLAQWEVELLTADAAAKAEQALRAQIEAVTKAALRGGVEVTVGQALAMVDSLRATSITF